MVSNSLGPFSNPPGRYPHHRIFRPGGLSNTTERIDSYPVSYMISGHHMNWKDTRRAVYPMYWIPPDKAVSNGSFGRDWVGLVFVRGGDFASIWFGFRF